MILSLCQVDRKLSIRKAHDIFTRKPLPLPGYVNQGRHREVKEKALQSGLNTAALSGNHALPYFGEERGSFLLQGGTRPQEAAAARTAGSDTDADWAQGQLVRLSCTCSCCWQTLNFVIVLDRSQTGQELIM